MGAGASLPDGSQLNIPDSAIETKDANVALVFIKPHAYNEKCIDYVRGQLNGIDGMVIIGECSISGKDVATGKLVDRHYSEIAKNAIDLQPSQLSVSEAAKQKFQDAFNLSWDEAIKSQSVFNAQECAIKLGKDAPLPASELSQRWDKAETKIKLCPGAYVTKLEDSIFVIDGFYPALREKFTFEKAQLRLFVVAFEPTKISWSKFRTEIIGATNPSKAKENSLRANILANYQNLDLAAPPDVTDNGVHGSAGPLEAIKERLVWLNFTLDNDPSATKLIGQNEDAAKRRSILQSFLDNPLIDTSTEQAPVFDLTEDKDTADLMQLLADALEKSQEVSKDQNAKTESEINQKIK